MEMKHITVRIKPKAKVNPRLLAAQVREAAYACSEEAWDGLLETAGVRAARDLHGVMRALASQGDYAGAMALLGALYALNDRELPAEVSAYQKRPALLQLFLDDFLEEADDFLGDLEFDEDEEGFEMDDLSG